MTNLKKTITRKKLYKNTKRLKKKIIKVQTKRLKSLLLIIDEIGIPTTDEKIELMRKAVTMYDDTIQEMEKNLKYPRLYLEPDNISSEENKKQKGKEK